MDRDPPTGWCDACQNTGWIDCHCGGDLCVCENNGEMECPLCHGDSVDWYEDED